LLDIIFRVSLTLSQSFRLNTTDLGLPSGVVMNSTFGSSSVFSNVKLPFSLIKVRIANREDFVNHARLIAYLLTIFLMLLAPFSSIAGNATYSYDDLGRLVRVTDENNQRVLYQYDKVGNLISITKEDSVAQALPPAIEGEDLEVDIINNNPDIIDIQSSVIIPAGASTGITVKALKAGMGTITIGNTEAMVYVYEDGTLMNAVPVSVYIESSVDATTVSSPLSVMIEQWPPVEATTVTVPVSVYVEESSAVSSITASSPVSAYIGESSTVNAITVSPPVSTKINSP
jgi:YD repeat-containing protein